MPDLKALAHHLLGPSTYDEVDVVRRTLPSHAPPGGNLLIDVGAHIGGTARPFVEQGWRVLAFEPDPANRQHLELVAAGRPNVTVDPRAVAEVGGQVLKLWTSDVSTGISSLSPFHPSHLPAVEVTTVRLDEALADVDLDQGWNVVLKTDTEGHDLFALRSYPWDRRHPDAIVCEFEDAKTGQLGYTWRDQAEFLQEQGYAVLVSEWYPIVAYGQRHRWRSIRPYPCDLEDERGWGNLIAVKPAAQSQFLRAGRAAGRRQALWAPINALRSRHQ